MIKRILEKNTRNKRSGGSLLWLIGCLVEGIEKKSFETESLFDSIVLPVKGFV